ncbi:hypothetical protein ACQPZF_39140 [Actinosynnema sp. CS-041913]|uniref:hypothetical protein n=1 Tax=Actinosynnema sp. CS-041913 TaxID=3239917 RepID=UPI003D94110C
MRVVLWAVAGLLVWPAAVLVAGGRQDWPWQVSVPLACAPALGWAVAWLVRRGAHATRGGSFWGYGLPRVAKRRGWEYRASPKGLRVAGEHRGVRFVLVDVEEPVAEAARSDTPPSARPESVLTLHGVGGLPAARFVIAGRCARIEADEGVARALRDEGFDHWLAGRGPAATLTTGDDRISAPFTDQTTQGFFALLDFLVDVAEHFPDRLRRG